MSIGDFYLQKKIQGGDISEFEQLFLKYYEPLCQHANKILKDMDTSEDIVQEFFYNFWKNRETFSPKLSLNAYLYQSIRNNALHYLEHLSVRQQYAQQMFDISNETEPRALQSEVEINELNRVVEATLKQMNERCSRVFTLNRFEGKKYREIADILSISVKTVEADMGKALQLFRKSLKEFTNGNISMNS